MITFEQAKQSANECIELCRKCSEKDDSGDSLVIEHSIEFENGWIFFVNSRLFLETHNIDYRPIGLGPILIGRENGDIYQAASGGNEEYWINKFNEYLQNKKSA